MAIQIFDKPGAGEIFGRELSSGLQQLANYKLGQLTQRQQAMRSAQGFEALGFSPKEAEQISQFDPEIQRYIAQEKMRGSQRSTTTGPGLQAIIPELSQQEAAKIGALPPSLQAQYYRNYLQTLGSQVPAEQQTGVQALLQQQPESIQQKEVEQVPMETLKAKVPSVIEQPSDIAKATIAKPKTVAERATEARAQKVALMEQREREKIQRAEQSKIDRETLKPYEEIINADKAATLSDDTLNRLEKLVNRGKLPPSGLYNLLNKLEEISPTSGAGLGAAIGAAGGAAGGPLAAAGAGALGGAIGAAISPIATILKSVEKGIYPDSEEFEKLSTSYVRGISNIFKGAISQQELKTFLQMIPTLSQTDVGKRAIINNMRLDNEAIHHRAKIASDIIAKNGGRRPANFAVLVEEGAKPGLIEIAQRRVSGPEVFDQIAKEEVKMPKDPSETPIGATMKYKGKNWVNTITQYGPRWMPIISKQ